VWYILKQGAAHKPTSHSVHMYLVSVRLLFFLHSWHLLLASLQDCVDGTSDGKCLSISFDGWSLVGGLDFATRSV